MEESKIDFPVREYPIDAIPIDANEFLKMYDAGNDILERCDAAKLRNYAKMYDKLLKTNDRDNKIFCCTVFYIDPTCNNHC